MMKGLAIAATVILALLGIGYLLILSGGKPIGDDLTIIGQGKPVLVLAYENYSPASGEALNSLRKIKSDYVDELDFVVADLGTPEGRNFADRYQLITGLAILMKKDGSPQEITAIPNDEQELRAGLDAKLSAVE